jgi:hypothetical protein
MRMEKPRLRIELLRNKIREHIRISPKAEAQPSVSVTGFPASTIKSIWH